MMNSATRNADSSTDSDLHQLLQDLWHCLSKYDAVDKAYSDESWSSPESTLSAEDFCRVCLLDANPAGEPKIKAKCHLPVRKTPGGPINRAALRNAKARLNQVQGVSGADKAKALARLNRLMEDAGMTVSKNNNVTDDHNVTDNAGENNNVTYDADIFKADEEKHVVYGVAYPVFPEGQADTQNDYILPEEIERMAWDFMIKSRTMDYQHKFPIDQSKAIPVESYIAPCDLEINGYRVAKGSWIVATKIFDDNLWNEIKKGHISSYSIRGRGKRKRVTL